MSIKGKLTTADSLNALLAATFRENWNRPALSNYRQTTITYGELARQIAQLHIFFESCSLAKGDKVAICSKNQVNWAVSFLATITYGAVAVPILHEFQPSNIRHLLSHSDAKIFFVGDAIWESMSGMDVPAQVVVTLSGFKVVKSLSPGPAKTLEDMDSLMAVKYSRGFRKESVQYHRDSPEELALINYTSGTSGFSKGVMLPYRSLMSNLLFSFEVEPQMDCNSSIISILPTAHMYGMMFEFLHEIAIGGHVYFLTRLPSPKVLLDAMADVKPDLVIAVPMIIEKIYKQMLVPFISKGRVRLLLNLPGIDAMVKNKIQQSLVQAFGGKFHEVIIGGAAFNKEAEVFLKRINFPFTIGYGMTECGPIITYVPFDRTKLFSCGKAAPRMEIKIESPDPQNVPGEILVRGDNVCLGYYKNPEATEAAFDGEWFRTGDMGVIDKDGYLFIKGRSKTMILGPSGQNIYPEEIESILNNMPFVVESLVIEDKGSLVALIYPDFEQVESEKLSQQQLLAKLQENMRIANLELPHYCKLASVEIFPEEFAKTPKKSIKRYLYQR